MGRVSIDTSGLSKKIKEIFVGTVDEITKQCEIYAANKLQEAYDNRTFQNDTYNLKDSYVWAVYHNGAMQSHGFLGMQEATMTQNFHGNAIIGRDEAQSFLASYNSRINKGWEIVLAAIAPYAEYLESGGGYMRSGYIVMSYIYDDVIKDFGLANVKTFQLNEGF